MSTLSDGCAAYAHGASQMWMGVCGEVGSLTDRRAAIMRGRRAYATMSHMCSNPAMTQEAGLCPKIAPTGSRPLVPGHRPRRSAGRCKATADGTLHPKRRFDPPSTDWGSGSGWPRSLPVFLGPPTWSSAACALPYSWTGATGTDAQNISDPLSQMLNIGGRRSTVTNSGTETRMPGWSLLGGRLSGSGSTNPQLRRLQEWPTP